MNERLNEAFFKYASSFDSDDPRFKLKIKHMSRVERVMRFLAKRVGLNGELIEVADVIGRLHDIGRFYQIKHFDTFNDHESIDHAEAGNIVLFTEGHLEEFVGNKIARLYGEVIRKAIFYHNKLALPEDTSDFTNLELTMAKLIRDADKIDIFNVLLHSKFSVTFKLADGVSPATLSPKVEEAFYKKALIDYRLRKSYVDDCITKIAYVFDFHYSESRKLLLKTRYLERLVANLFEQVDIKDELTKGKIYDILHFATDYLEKN